MVFFRVSQNINIKTTDGSLIKYAKLTNTSNMSNNNIYVSTYDEVQKLNDVFKKVGPTFKSKILLENSICSNKTFPIELGILNKYEYKNIENFKSKIGNNNFLEYSFKEDLDSFIFNEDSKKLYEQLTSCTKKDIKIVIIGNVGDKIGEMIAALTALRLLKQYLNKKFKSVQLDIYLEAAQNVYYSRDKEILGTQDYIDNIKPLAIDLKTLCEYDFYIDNSLVKNRSFYKVLSYVDAYLYKFAMPYLEILPKEKYNSLNISKLTVNPKLIEEIKKLKKNKEKLLLYHPFSAKAERSIPQESAYKFLRKLIKKAPDYKIVSALAFANFKENSYCNLGEYSKSISDFIYLISCMDAIITVDTSTYHIADAFFIPTVVFFKNDDYKLRLKYYSCTKAIRIKDKTKSFSKFKFDADALVLYKFDSYKELKVSEVITVLESI